MIKIKQVKPSTSVGGFFVYLRIAFALVVQLDRISDFGSEG
jgi:hypothetical protein